MKTLLLLLTFIPLAVFGQVTIQNNLLSTSGGSQSNGNVVLDFSFGEVFTATFENSTNILTQGFEQPRGKRQIFGGMDTVKYQTSAYIAEEDFGSFKVYPNPTLDFITLETSQQEDLHVELIDMTGRIIDYYDLNGIKSKMDLRSYENGTYYLLIRTKQGNQARIPIVKTN